MVSPVGSAGVPVAELVHGSQSVAQPAREASGKSLPPSGITAAAQRAAPDPAALVALLNKFSNDSGLPTQYRVAPQTDGKLIQEINPANGDVLGEFSASEFPALAASIGVSSTSVDERA